MDQWFYKNIVYLTKHGSQCYGLATDLSDFDMKGIVLPPRSVENDLFHRFEQAENDKRLEETWGHLKNPKNPKFESTVYSLKKFFQLAANTNPNIIELLFVDPKDHLYVDESMLEVMDNRHLFLSSKAKFTFSGYAMAQLAKIERHRKWIVLGELKEPKREDFGLPPVRARQLDDVFGYIKGEVEKWNLSKFSMDEMERSDLKEAIWELINNVSKLEVGWDNWPQVYEAGVVERISKEYDLKEEVVDLLNRERQFKKSSEQYKSWLNWRENRNPERHKLEVKSAYDTKHASHLVRLMRMGLEILTKHDVIVRRPDREEILAIKNGAWTYDQVISYANNLQLELDAAYKTTKLPKSVDYQKINSLYHRVYEKYSVE